MSKPSLAHLLISTATMGGITVLRLEFTANAVKKVVQLANETFTEKGAEERKRQREIQEEVRRLERILRREEEEEKEAEEATGKTD